MGETIIGRPRDLRLHIRTGLGGESREETVTLLMVEQDGPYGVDRWKVNLRGAADFLGYLERIPNHRPYNVVGRIRYDLARRTVWRSNRPGEDRVPGLYEETRSDAIAYLLDVYRGDVHMPGRPGWRSCDLCS